MFKKVVSLIQDIFKKPEEPKNTVIEVKSDVVPEETATIKEKVTKVEPFVKKTKVVASGKKPAAAKITKSTKKNKSTR